MLTVVFSDLVGSTRLSQTLDPEDMRDLLDAYQRECAGIVERYGGHVAQYLGDGILIYFGYPIAHEDAARRAVGAACEIAGVVPRIRTPASIPLLEVRIGIHTGVTVVGMIGSGQRRENLAVGGAPNVAARIQTMAPPNTVLVSETTRGLVDGYYSCEPFERELDGVQAPRLFRVIGATGAARSIDAAMAVGLTQFVGRAKEVTTLQGLWSGAVEGTTHAILLTGEAGIGKSRLVQVLKAGAARGAARVVEWHCSEDAQGTVLGPVADAIARQVDITDDVAGDERLKKLQKGLAEFGSFNDAALWLLGSLLAIPPGERGKPVDTRPQNIRKKTLEALLDLVKSLSNAQPLLLVIEDVHWADHSTLELIALMLDRLKQSRALLVITARPQFQSPWETLTALELKRLQCTDVHQIIHDVARGRDLPSEILEELAARSEGVPLFVEELTRAVLESNSLVDRGDRYELLLPLEGVLFPTTIQESMSARFHRLGESKRLAQVASVFGRSFSYDMIRAIDTASDADLRRDLAELVRADFLHVVEEANDGQWTFKHAMMRETAYTSQLIKVRRELHAKIATALVERFSDGVMPQPALVAHHFTQAGAAAKAVPHWVAAGKQALDRSANQEAVACLTPGLELVMQLPEGEERANWELTMRVLIGPALMAIKGFSHREVLESYTRAHELLKQVGNAPQMFGVMWGLWAQHFVAGQLSAAREPAEQVVRMAQGSGGSALKLPAHNALGYVECYTAHYPETVKLVEEGLAAFDLGQERQNCLTFQFSSALALMNMGATALWMLGKPDQARKLAARARPLAEELGHPPSTAFAAASSAWFVQLAGDAGQVQAIVEEVNRLSEHEGFDLWPPLVSVFGGWARMVDGDASAGVEIMSDGFRRYRAIGGGVLSTHGMALLAEGLLEAGRIAESLNTIDEALKNAHSLGEVHFEPELHRVKGLALLKQARASGGSLDAGRAALEYALRLAHEQQAYWLELRSALALARLLHAQGESQRASATLAPIYEAITEGRDTREMRDGAELLAELAKA